MTKQLNIKVITFGSPDIWAQPAVKHWYKRISALSEIELQHIHKRNHKTLLRTLIDKSNKINVALTQNGKPFSTQDWGILLENSLLFPGQITFVIGDAEGLPEQVITTCSMQISLSRLTLQHDIALLVLLEQIYRALSINAGLPYHRGD